MKFSSLALSHVVFFASLSSRRAKERVVEEQEIKLSRGAVQTRRCVCLSHSLATC